MKKDDSHTKAKLVEQPALHELQIEEAEWAPATLIDVDLPLLSASSGPRMSHKRANWKQSMPAGSAFSVDVEALAEPTPTPLPAAYIQEQQAKASPLDTPRALPGRHTTVLPNVEFKGGEMVLTQQRRERYDSLARLGEGGAGEVVLVKDNDIHRKVAMKRVKADLQDNVHLARFVEEIKTVGQLEHPNITPIHDVGVDETGQHYFTMKYVEGDTLEDIIKKLRAGDAEYHKRFTYERRTQIFIEILQAVRFAHDKGIIHRDIKPANIMVGAYGEVMVMDWGIAKQVDKPDLQSPGRSTLVPRHGSKEEQERAFETALGSLLGTPAYMSPEQATGYNNLLDQRSDTYSLCVLFYEFLNLRHPLEHKQGLQQLLWGVLDEEPADSESLSNPYQGPVPRELCFFLRKGLKKDPKERFQNVDVMIEELQANMEGRICVYCPSTFLKRSAHGYGHYLDNHRVLGVVLFVLLLGVLGVGVWHTAQALLAAFA